MAWRTHRPICNVVVALPAAGKGTRQTVVDMMAYNSSTDAFEHGNATVANIMDHSFIAGPSMVRTDAQIARALVTLFVKQNCVLYVQRGLYGPFSICNGTNGEFVIYTGASTISAGICITTFPCNANTTNVLHATDKTHRHFTGTVNLRTVLSEAVLSADCTDCTDPYIYGYCVPLSHVPDFVKAATGDEHTVTSIQVGSGGVKTKRLCAFACAHKCNDGVPVGWMEAAIAALDDCSCVTHEWVKTVAVRYEDQSVRKNNCTLLMVRNTTMNVSICIVASIKEINQGDEIKLRYGPGYWMGKFMRQYHGENTEYTSRLHKYLTMP